jgi:hypothetical protein
MNDDAGGQIVERFGGRLFGFFGRLWIELFVG